MVQYRRNNIVLDKSAGAPATIPARTALDDTLAQLNPREFFGMESGRVVPGAADRDFRLRGTYNGIQARPAGTRRPGLPTIGTKGQVALGFGISPLTGTTGSTNGALVVPNISLIGGADSGSFLAVFAAYFVPQNSSAGISAATGTIFGEASVDGQGMSLAIDGTGRVTYDPMRQSGSFAARTQPGTHGDPHGTTSVYALDHNVPAGKVRIFRDNPTTPWIEASNVTEAISTGMLKFGGLDATFTGSAGMGIVFLPGFFAPGIVSDGYRAEEMAMLAALL